jgi:hypothetical protein
MTGDAGDGIIDARDAVSGNDAADGGADFDWCVGDAGDTITGCEQ